MIVWVDVYEITRHMNIPVIWIYQSYEYTSRMNMPVIWIYQSYEFTSHMNIPVVCITNRLNIQVALIEKQINNTNISIDSLNYAGILRVLPQCEWHYCQISYTWSQNWYCVLILHANEIIVDSNVKVKNPYKQEISCDTLICHRQSNNILCVKSVIGSQPFKEWS